MKKFLEDLAVSIFLMTAWGVGIYFMVNAALFPSAAIHCAFLGALAPFFLFMYLDAQGLRRSLWMAMVLLMPLNFVLVGIIWLILRWLLALAGIDLPGL
jgi:hypothetical protein